jgi:hypothetical protein
MTWSEVQAISGTATATGATGITQAYGSNVTAGNVLVAACIYTSNNQTATFSDSQTNTWTTLGSYHSTSVSGTYAIGFAIAGSSAANTPKCVWGGGTSSTLELYIGEFVPPSGTISQDGAAESTQAATGSPVITPAAGGTGSNDLLINLLGFQSSWTSWGGSWASMGSSQSGDACGYLLNASGSAAPDANCSGTTWASLIVALQASGGGGSSVVGYVPGRMPMGC